MQIFNLDLTEKRIIPLLFAKQGDVGRKFKVVLTDGGAEYQIPAEAAVSVWYSGAAGNGNYTEIGEDSAVSVVENEITVELITQMLTNGGPGALCLVINTADGDQLGMWSIPYMVESVPGMGSAAAEQYYTAFSKSAAEVAAAAKNFTIDKTLTVSGSPADAEETGRQISVERSRINQLAKLPEGSTTGDAEMADARVGYDGTTYDNLGEAIRGQAASAIHFVAQNLTPEQKAQARENIDACTVKDVADKLCPTFTESGSIVTCEPVEGYPLTVQTEEGATKVIRCGKNVFPNVSRSLVKSYISIELKDNIFTINGTANGSNGFGGYDEATAFTLPAGTYAWQLKRVSGTCTYSGESGTFYLRKSNGGSIVANSMYGTSNRGGTFTLAEPTRMCVDILCKATYENFVMSFQIEVGDTATDFEPYCGGEFGVGEPVPALKGVNTIYADSGEITVTGKADPVVIINKLSAAIEAITGV